MNPTDIRDSAGVKSVIMAAGAQFAASGGNRFWVEALAAGMDNTCFVPGF